MEENFTCFAKKKKKNILSAKLNIPLNPEFIEVVKVFFKYMYELSVRRRLSALADKTLLNLHNFI